MALFDSVLNLVNKKSKAPKDATPFDVEARQASEAKMKDRAGMVISVFALILAVNSWYGNKLSSQTLNNTIAANDVWSFYEAKSIKQMLTEQSLEVAVARKDSPEHIAKLEAKIARYESEPATGEGKKELMAKAKAIEAERDRAKKQSPWIGFAGTLYQLSIVVLSASILAVIMSMFWGSIGVAALGALLMAQGIWLFI